MKIVHITPVFVPYASGMTNVAYEQTRELARRGHEVVVLTPRYNPDWKSEEVIEGITVKRINPLVQMGNAAFTPGMISALRALITPETKVQIHLPFFGAYEWLWYARNFGVLKNARLTTLYHHDPQLSGITSFLSLPSKLVFKSLITSSDTVVVSSRDYAQHSAIGSFLDQCTVAEVPFGIHPERFAPGEKNSADTVNMLFVGAMDKAHHFKGVSVLLEALAKLESTQYKLKLVGKGDLLDGYKAQAKELGLEDRVAFLGFISDEELPQYHAAADLFIFPSTGKAEAFGMVALEAMSAGLPVIASNLPGVRALIGREDMLTEPGNAEQLAAKIDTLLRDREMRDRIGAENRERVLSTYTWTKVVDRLEELYRN